MIQFRNIYKSYPGKEVLKGVTFNVEVGTIHGFLGPNGAGKSSLMNILLEIIDLDGGEILLPEDYSIGYLPENPPLYSEMEVQEYLTFVQKIYGKGDEQYLQYIIEECGLSEVSTRKISFLSKGFKQRVGIAQAICHKPDLLVLDEPLVGLDPHAVIQLKDLIRKLAKKYTILISSHQLSELQQLCTHISILHKGEIMQTGAITEIESNLSHGQKVLVEFSSIAKEDLAELEIPFTMKDGNRVEFQASDRKDIRPILSRYFMEKQLSVLTQQEVKLDLEEIFKVTTSEGVQ